MPSEGPTFGFSIYQRIPEKKHTIQHYYCRYNQYFCWSAGFDCVGTNFGYLAGAWMWPLEFHPKLWTCIKMITAGGDKEIKNNHWLWISWSWWITTCFGNSDVYLILLVGGPTGRHITVLICLVAMKKNHPQLSCLSTFDGRSLLMGNVNFWGLFYMYPPSMAFDAPGSGWWWWWWWWLWWWWLWWLKEMIPSSGSMFPSWKWYHQKLS